MPNCAGRHCGPDCCGRDGTCGSCLPGASCDAASGQCSGGCSAESCPTGTTCCGDACVDTATDPQHCGSCIQRCVPGFQCAGGTCQGNCGNDPNVFACPDGTCCLRNKCLSCPGINGPFGICVDDCSSGQRCDQGFCICDAQSCPNGCCQDQLCIVNNDNAGGRGGGTCVACPSGQSCCGGEYCGGATGKTCCGNACVDLGTDPDHCGDCSRNCGGQVCCPTGQAVPGLCCDHCCGSGPAQDCCDPGEVCCGSDGSVCCPGPTCCGLDGISCCH